MKFLSVDRLNAGMVLAQDVFLDSNPTQAYLRRGIRLSAEVIERLTVLGVSRVAVRDEAAAPATPAIPPRLLQTARSSIIAPKPTVDHKLRDNTLDSLHTVFSDIWINDNGFRGEPDSLDDVNSMVEKLVGTIMRDRAALVNINDLKSFDDYTYHHSLSVAVLSIGIGQQMGISTRQLNKLGLAAIMHDIGKTAVPIEIIRKPSKLTDSEFALMKYHSKAGSSYLIGSSIGDEWLWGAVLGHHEKLDGTGYPNGLKGEQIPLWSRIISVADVYDALTSHRPYRQPMPATEALEYIMGGVGTAFDYDVVQALVRKVAPYPVGSCVELSDGSYGLVVAVTHPARPVVEILGRGDIVDLQEDRQYLNVLIRRQVMPVELGQIG
ncbi:HD-GYP domain-containing protein [Ruminococcaceae bacterium OttesenSCG-928-A11]|nr:HD-GYP domain-containing protein [Ruminococcaceae bacterium OttesenSCG-928-A11]